MNQFLHALGLEKGADVNQVDAWSLLIQREWPPFVLYTIIILGALLALVNFWKRLSMRLSTRIWSFVIRAGVVALILVMFYGVSLHLELSLKKNQKWLLLVDDSASMQTPDHQKNQRFLEALKDMKQIQGGLSENIQLQVKTLSGSSLQDKCGQGPTPLEHAVRREVMSRRDYDRLIILSDGRDSDDRDLTQLGADLKARDIALSMKIYGSESKPDDFAIQAFLENNLLRIGEVLNIRAEISGQSKKPQSIVLKENGKVVKTISINPSEARQFRVNYKPAKKGRYVYSLEVQGNDDITKNNVSSFTAEIVEDKLNVLLIEGFPRFEFKLMKSVLEVDPLINLVSISHIPGGGVYVQGKPLHKKPEQGLLSSQSDLFKYDVIILRDVSRNLFRAGGDTSESLLLNIVNFVKKRGGGLFVCGGQEVYRAGAYEKSHLAPILPFDLSSGISKKPQFKGKFFVDVVKTAFDHPILKLLPNSLSNQQRLKNLPELDGSNNVGRFRPFATPLMTRTLDLKSKSGANKKVTVPIMAYQAIGDGKVVATAVDTLWRWQLQAEFDDPPLTMLLANIVRYISPPPTKSAGSPQIEFPSHSPQVGQQFELSTILKDKNYDPITEAELVVTVVKPDKSKQLIYPRDLPEEAGFYRYKIRCDQPGAYTVKSKYGKREESRELFVGNAFGEYADSSADKKGMAKLSKSAGGDIFDDVPVWLDGVDQRAASESVTRQLEIWCSPLVLILFLALISLDCYIRKRQGLV